MKPTGAVVVDTREVVVVYNRGWCCKLQRSIIQMLLREEQFNEATILLRITKYTNKGLDLDGFVFANLKIR
jgi:hypothetical protein